mgnify:CR=1 FL=1|tara:strand:+ start:1380 stop:2099 length:720 start_codon:yes stop_codon:yes gene_type:complete
MSRWDKQVCPHGPLEEIGAGLWQVTGSLKRSPLPRNMVVWRTPKKSLLIHSAICLDEVSMKELDSLGPVSHVVVPCEMHRADAKAFQDRYSEATFLAPACAREKVSQVISGFEDLEEGLEDLNVTLHRPAGLKDFELHLELPLEDGSRALVMTDALFNLAGDPPKGFGGFLVKLLGSVGPLNITKIGRRMLLENKNDYANYVRDLSKISNLSVLSVAHGQCIREDVVAELIAASERIRK